MFRITEGSSCDWFWAMDIFQIFFTLRNHLNKFDLFQIFFLTNFNWLPHWKIKMMKDQVETVARHSLYVSNLDQKINKYGNFRNKIELKSKQFFRNFKTCIKTKVLKIYRNLASFVPPDSLHLTTCFFYIKSLTNSDFLL